MIEICGCLGIVAIIAILLLLGDIVTMLGALLGRAVGSAVRRR